MKNIIILLFSLLCLSSCEFISNANEINDSHTVYADYSEVTTSDFSIKVDSYRSELKLLSYDYSTTIILSIKNISENSQRVSFSEACLKRSASDKTCAIDKTQTKCFSELNVGEEKEAKFCFTTQTNAYNSKFYFSVNINNDNYKVYLYETPDELREDLIVSYIVEDRVVHQETVKKGRLITSGYVYDFDEHQRYCDTWCNLEGIPCTYEKIEDHTNVYGRISESVKYMTSASDRYTFITGLNHVHPDGKVVISEKYLDKEVSIFISAFRVTKMEVKEIYFPITLHGIYHNDFASCNGLQTIYYAGTAEQWEAIEKERVTIPSRIRVVCGNTFTP